MTTDNPEIVAQKIALNTGYSYGAVLELATLSIAFHVPTPILIELIQAHGLDQTYEIVRTGQWESRLARLRDSIQVGDTVRVNHPAKIRVRGAASPAETVSVLDAIGIVKAMDKVSARIEITENIYDAKLGRWNQRKYLVEVRSDWLEKAPQP